MEDGTTSESCTFYVGGLSAVHEDTLSNASSCQKTICPELLGLRCSLNVPHFSVSTEQINTGVWACREIKIKQISEEQFEDIHSYHLIAKLLKLLSIKSIILRYQIKQIY